MNPNFRLLSALLRSDWLIDEQYAHDNLEFVNGLLNGTLDRAAFLGDDGKKEEKPLAYAVTIQRAALTGAPTTLTRYSASDPEMPEGSVLVMNISGPIFKEGFCGGGGTVDYARTINEAYANPKIIGIVCLVDSPGGQLSGTPTLYDAIRNPIKPVVSVIDEGCMASAALWLACGSDFIYATQPTDQVGSIGVFVTLRDSSEAMAKAGYKTITVYSDRSPQKNKPVREALAGNTKPLRDDLNRSADLFRKAVETGRGDRLKPKVEDGPDIFEGGMFYADDAIEMGLIDGFGNLETAVNKVIELHNTRSGSGSALAFTGTQPTAAETAPVVQAQTETTQQEEPSAPDNSATQSNLNSTDMSLFGNKHKVLSSLANKQGAEITDQLLNDVNAELDEQKITAVRIISTAYLELADQSVAALNQANTQITTLTTERDNARAEAAKFGSQPGTMPTTSQKVDEKITTEEKDTYISQTDADLAAMRAKL